MLSTAPGPGRWELRARGVQVTSPAILGLGSSLPNGTSPGLATSIGTAWSATRVRAGRSRRSSASSSARLGVEGVKPLK